MENDEIIHGNGSEILKCMRFPPKVHSNGISIGDKTPLTYSVPVLELQMVMFFALTQLLHFPLKYLGIPHLLSEIMAGVILGQTFLSQHPKFQTTVFPVEGQGIVGTLSSFGFALFMFTSGVKMDVSMLKRTGAKAWVIGLLNWFVPIVTSTVVAETIFVTQGTDTISDTKENVPVLITIHATTSFPVIAQLLKDVRISNSELGRLALSSALISNLIGTSVAAMMQLLLVAKSGGMGDALENLVLLIVFICLVSFVFRPLMFWVAKQTPEGRPVKDIYVYLIILGFLISSVFMHYIELHVPLGSLLFGLAVPEGHPLGTAVVDKLELYTSGILLPLFVSFNTLRTDLGSANFRNPVVLNNFILATVTFFSKTFPCLIATLYCRMPFNDGLALGLIMSAKGVVDLAKDTSLRDRKIISQPTFAVVVITTVLNVAFVPMLVRWLYNPSRKYAGYQKRNIMHTKQNTMLPIFVCIHRPDNILAITRLLDASNPKIAVFVLHLIELRGRATPIFISHKLQTKTVANISYSENVIAVFSEYERNHRGSVTVQIFTAISPRQLMHEDICGLALDTLTSLIIIPFHRRWTIDGSIEFDDVGLRTLNLSVIERAPCSVGILIDRGHSPRGEFSSDQGAESITDVAVIFIGGSDDQEALLYAKGMTKKSSIMLTVVHLVSTEAEEEEEREYTSDKERTVESEMLNEMKKLSDMRYIRYMKKKVKGGHETALIIRVMVNVYDLIIVGRRKDIDSPQTSGLLMWSEFPELGILGDLLASSDIKGKASGLVLQQQEMNC